MNFKTYVLKISTVKTIITKKHFILVYKQINNIDSKRKDTDPLAVFAQ